MFYLAETFKRLWQQHHNKPCPHTQRRLQPRPLRPSDPVWGSQGGGGSLQMPAHLEAAPPYRWETGNRKRSGVTETAPARQVCHATHRPTPPKSRRAVFYYLEDRRRERRCRLSVMMMSVASSRAEMAVSVTKRKKAAGDEDETQSFYCERFSAELCLFVLRSPCWTSAEAQPWTHTDTHAQADTHSPAVQWFWTLSWKSSRTEREAEVRGQSSPWRGPL